MSDYVFLVGDDYESSNKEYVAINTDNGKLISIALAASGIPFKGRLRYDIDVKPTVRLLYQQVDTRNMEVNNEKIN